MSEATQQVDLAERASEFLMGVLERMGIAADIEVHDENERIILEIQTADTELVIGRRGVVVDSLQHLVNKVVYRERAGEKGKPFIVDAGGYREKQIDRLKALAQKMAEKALQTKAIVELSPMSAHDRRIVHMEISTIAGLTTRSEGEGEDRHILVVPADLAS
ncbi:MAG: KH domain-containing protein [Kofleriaceae bacterium]|nr:KH domain-containing protein [Kofleriaceae bacterium]MBP6837772.1 KH domain-containing protein [Kofleriaceae bacterium]MBP9203665.1 KH domain-containing protein [Kofleriaceae bacterium]